MAVCERCGSPYAYADGHVCRGGDEAKGGCWRRVGAIIGAAAATAIAVMFLRMKRA